MAIRLDHVLIRTENLSGTVLELQNMGFKVYYGSTRKNCHHAMVYFSDHSFVEFIDPSRFPAILRFLAKRNLMRYFGPFLERVGVYAVSPKRYLDYSFYSSDIETLYQQAKGETKVSKLMTLKRVDFFHTKLTWKLFVYADPEMPFMMSDYTPNKYPERDCTVHANGITGISEVKVGTDSLETYAKKLSRFLNISVKNNMFQLGDTPLVAEEANVFEIKSIVLSGSTGQFDLSALKKYHIETSA